MSESTYMKPNYTLGGNPLQLMNMYPGAGVDSVVVAYSCFNYWYLSDDILALSIMGV